MVARGDVEVSMTITDVDVKVDNLITLPFESVPRLIDIILRVHRYSVELKFRSRLSPTDSFSFHYSPPGTLISVSGGYPSGNVSNNGLLGTSERLRDMADFMERLQREVGIEGSRIFVMYS